MRPRVILGVSGASGAILGLEIARLLSRFDVDLDLTKSSMAERTLALEVGSGAQAELEALAARVYDIRDLGANIASGSYLSQA